jgi:hypothetical protein
LSAASALSFAPIPSGQCSANLTFFLPGAAAGDAVAPGWPAALDPGLLGIMWISAADTVSVRMCNFSGTALAPASDDIFRATIIRSF